MLYFCYLVFRDNILVLAFDVKGTQNIIVTVTSLPSMAVLVAAAWFSLSKFVAVSSSY
jgi:hypothetical protein